MPVDVEARDTLILEAYRAGDPIRLIAQTFHVSQTTVSTMARKAGLPSRYPGSRRGLTEQIVGRGIMRCGCGRTVRDHARREYWAGCAVLRAWEDGPPVQSRA